MNYGTPMGQKGLILLDGAIVMLLFPHYPTLTLTAILISTIPF